MLSNRPAFGLAPTLVAPRLTPAFSTRHVHVRSPRPRVASHPLTASCGPPSPNSHGSSENNSSNSCGGSEHFEGGSPPERVPLANLHELTERISDLLQIGSIENSKRSPAPIANDGRHDHLNASSHIVVVFGKRLIRDQVSVEYAKRIVTLVKQLASGALDPHIICFTGGRAPGGCVTEAAAGYAFFRSVCEEAGVDVDDYSYLLEEKSTSTLQNVHNVIAALRRRCNPEAITNCHFTLVSSDYHIIRMQEVHRLNVQESALFPLQLFSASWNFIFAAYPFCVSRVPATAFLGRAIVLANDLSIVVVNLNGVVSRRQFMAKDNVHRLQETFAKMRDMYRVINSRSYSGFRTDMRKHAETLELAIHRVREVHTTLLPLQEDGGTVSPDDMEMALRLLMSVVRDIRESMDPDRVLLVTDRIAVVEDMASFVSRESKRRPNKQDSSGFGFELHENDIENDIENRGASSSYGNSVNVPFADDKKFDVGYEDGMRRKACMISELAGHGGTRFAGNGKRIARDGPNVVVLDDMAAAPREPLKTTAVLDDINKVLPGPTGTPEVKRPRARRASTTASRNGGTLRAASTSRGAGNGAAGTRKRRTTGLTSKPKASGAGRPPAKRKTPAKRADAA